MKKLLIFLLFTVAAHAWWDAGHLLTAEIAYQNLTPEKRKEYSELCEAFKPFYPKTSTFVTASIWADEIKENHRLSIFDRGHFINIPYDPEHILTKEQKALIQAKNQDTDVVWMIKETSSTLKNPHANRFEKALALRLLIHCVADVHQPIHCATLYNKRFPKGDQGGNLFRLKGSWSTLHLLWDSGAGAFPQNFYLRDPFDVTPLAHSLMQSYPKNSLPPVTSTPKQWAQESHKLAAKVAYTIEPGTTPSSDYLEKTQETCRRQVTLAGYRLAALLNNI